MIEGQEEERVERDPADVHAGLCRQATCPGTCEHCGFYLCPDAFDVNQCDGAGGREWRCTARRFIT